MTDIIRKYGLSHMEMEAELKRSIGVQRIEVKGEMFLAAHNGCVEECRGMENNSVGLIHTSIPFSNHYEYTPSYNDFGQVDSKEPVLHGATHRQSMVNGRMSTSVSCVGRGAAFGRWFLTRWR